MIVITLEIRINLLYADFQILEETGETEFHAVKDYTDNTLKKQ
jgi:hypothetical protein